MLIFSKVLILLTFLHEISGYNYGHGMDSIIPSFDNRLNGLNSTLVVTQHQIVNIQAAIRTITHSHQVDISKVFSQLIVITRKLEQYIIIVDQYRGNIEIITTVEGLETKVTELEDKVKELERLNQLWRQNFQVVNRTFTSLRNLGCFCSTAVGKKMR